MSEPAKNQTLPAEGPAAQAGRRLGTRWAVAVLVVMVRGYQGMISPLLGPKCRFMPTCSEYFIQAVQKYGAVKGAWMGVCRILRCHPWHPGGYDPP